jgi:hypothetical protein
VLARALPPSQRAHAIELATQARDVLRIAGNRWSRARKLLDKWLANPDAKD